MSKPLKNNYPNTHLFILLVILSSKFLYELSMMALPLSLFWYMSSIFSFISFGVAVFGRSTADRTALLPIYTKHKIKL